MKRLMKIFVLTAVMTLMFAFTVHAEDVSEVNSSLVNQINSLRQAQGLNALSVDGGLSSIAATRAQEASSTWSHTRPNGTQGVDMIASNKWRGENLSYVQYSSFGFSSEEQSQAANIMFGNLKASPTHYDNMVFGDFTKIGVYTYVSNDGSGVKLTTAYMFSN